jgi:hypothetical protein
MANLSGNFRRTLVGLELLATALSGTDTPSSFLLGGFGFVLLVLSVLVLVFAMKQWKSAKPGRSA